MSNATGANYDVYLQQFSGTGSKIGGEIVVSNLVGNQLYSSVAVLSDGSYVVTYRGPDSVGNGVYQRVFYLDHVIDGDPIANTLTGDGNFANTINGMGGDDILSGGSGPAPDTLNGGDGNDTLIMSGGDFATGGAGNDTFKIVHLNGQNLQFTDTGGYDTVDTTTLDFNPIFYLTNSQGIEQYNGGGVDDNVDAHWTTIVPVFTFNGGAGNDSVVGTTGNDVLNGGDGNDILNGWSGNDTMTGGIGDDIYAVDSISDLVTELSSQGTDMVNSAVSYTLTANVENLTLMGAININGTGNTLANTMIGTSGNNILDGGAGADTMTGGLGNDTYVVDVLTDVVVEKTNEGTDTVKTALTYTLGLNLENLSLTGTANVNATGNTLANMLTGNAGKNILTGLDGNDVLDGGANADKMIGGLGNDSYYIDNAGDVVTELSNGGTDTVFSTRPYTLGSNLEKLTLLGNGNAAGTGNALANTLVGNEGNNRLNGGDGNDSLIGGLGDDTLDGGRGGDTMRGGLGNDRYYLDGKTDIVVEFSGQGTDQIVISATYTLAANVENLSLTGSGAYFGTGNALNNVINGNNGNNTLGGAEGNDSINGGKGADVMRGGLGTLDGGLGVDTLKGGAGNDTYWVDNAGDVVVELAAAGTDTVNASVSFSLAGQQIENINLTGNANINATGNSLVNVMTGNSGNNTLDGGGGADTMTGGLGDDTYIVDNTGDMIVEGTAQGTDLVRASVTYSLSGKQVENMTLTGTANINGTGNSLANVLTGNSGNNVLDGGSGADTMAGGTGDDTYYVDNIGDVVTEAANAGTDTVISSVTYTLAGRAAENLTINGSAAASATGNSLANVLSGNNAANTLDGGSGADTLTGHGGADIFLFNTASGADTITDFSAAQSDSINVNAYTHGTAHTAYIVQVGGDVHINLGGTNVITVTAATVADVTAHMVW